MRTFLFSCAAAAAFLVASTPAGAMTPQAPGAPAGQEPAPPAKEPAASVSWTTSYKDALVRAKKEKKLIVAAFIGSDCCATCTRLGDEVFSKPEFQQWAQKNVILLELDFPQEKKLPKEVKEQNEKLKKEHKVVGTPTVLFLDSKGKKVGQVEYEDGGAESWIQKAEAVAKKKDK